jgi:hypothetical protein
MTQAVTVDANAAKVFAAARYDSGFSDGRQAAKGNIYIGLALVFGFAVVSAYFLSEDYASKLRSVKSEKEVRSYDLHDLLY